MGIDSTAVISPDGTFLLTDSLPTTLSLLTLKPGTAPQPQDVGMQGVVLMQDTSTACAAALRYYWRMRSDHPDEAALKAFASGKTPKDEIIRIDEHVRDCPECLQLTLALVRAKVRSLKAATLRKRPEEAK